ncbi:MAG TPA: CRTAC1 family protein [Actinomycetota bacterium]|nr:CRTAC1 family protein [Actinomycetota bacterium]
MQSVGPATDTGADSGGGRQRDPSPKAARPPYARATAWWLVLGGIGGALVALAVVLSLGLFLTGAGESEAAAPRFVEEAEAAGIHHVYDGDFPYFVGGGVATFDCDGDRRPDLYVAGGANAAALYRNESPIGGALRFERVSDPATDLGRVLGAYPIDIDGDGLTDLAVLRNGENVLLRGRGDCRFERANETWGYRGGHALTAAFSATWEGSAAMPTLAFGNYLDLRDPERSECADSELVRPGSGRQRYAEPIPLGPGYCTLSVLFSDWDRSGRRDLRMANDRHYYLDGEEQLWRIDEGEAPRLYTREDGWQRLVIWGMGIASYDVTGDGVPEVYLTSQGDNKLQTLANASDRPTYEDIAIDQGVTATRPYTGGDPLPSTAWHPEFQDVNDDGFVDLFVSKGNVEAQQDFASKDPSDLLIGQADGTFVEGGLAAGIASFVRGRGAAVVDLNLDGMPDIVQVNRRANVSLFRNVGSGTAAEPRPMGNWIAVRPEQTGPNRDAIGSWIQVRFGGRRTERELTIGGGHASGELGWIHFGLGGADSAEVRVLWPDGEAGPWQEVSANRFVTIPRGAEPATWTPAEPTP